MATLDDDDRAWIEAVISDRLAQTTLAVDPPPPPTAEEIRAAGEADAERIRASGDADVQRIEAAADAAEQIEEAAQQAAADDPGDPDAGTDDALDLTDGDALGVDASPEPQHWMEKPLFRRNK